MRFFIPLFGFLFSLQAANIVDYAIDDSMDNQWEINLSLDENWNGEIQETKENGGVTLTFAQLGSKIVFNKQSVQLKAGNDDAKLIIKTEETLNISIENRNNNIAIFATSELSPLSIESIAKEASGDYSVSIFDILWYAVIFVAIAGVLFFALYRLNAKRRLAKEVVQANDIAKIDEFVQKDNEKPIIKNQTEKLKPKKVAQKKSKEKPQSKTLFDI